MAREAAGQVSGDHWGAHGGHVLEVRRVDEVLIPFPLAAAARLGLRFCCSVGVDSGGGRRPGPGGADRP